jgi:multidrug efflux system outer membrane protein
MDEFNHIQKERRVRVLHPIIGLISGLAMAWLLAGCAAVGPDYVPPDAKAPAKWNAPLEEGLAARGMDAQVLASWWTTLDDPLLASLEERAALGNLDLREATARVREARARRGVARADLFPSVDATGSARRSRTSGAERDLYSAGFDSSWELDLFGGVRRSVEAAEADLGASEEDLRDVLVTLLSEVALNYVDVRSFQARLSIAQANLKAQEETYDITRWRFEAGLTSQLDVEQARANMENTRSQIPSLRTGLAQAMNRISILLGESPGALDAELSGQGPVPAAPLEVAVGVPAEALRQRPDVRRAERQLAAQTARVGVATAELYPRFTLSGSIGLEALSFGGLFSTRNRTYGIGSGFTWNVFHAGAVRQNIEVQDALQEQALTRYESAVLSALEEVENALAAYAGEQVRRQSLAESSEAARRAADLAGEQYSAGLIDFQVVLDAQRSLLNSQDQLATSEAEIASDLIRLYKALGGGWTPLPEASGAPQAQLESEKDGK